MVLKGVSQRQRRWRKAMFLCNSSTLLGAPLRSCWSMRQTKAFVAILMQINCIRHNLAFHVSPVPPGVRLPSLKPWEPAQSLHTALSCPTLLSIARSRKRLRALRWTHQQQNRGRKVWFLAPWLGPMSFVTQPCTFNGGHASSHQRNWGLCCQLPRGKQRSKRS